MKIVFVCPSFYPHIGGVETVVFQLASTLAAKGHGVTVLTQRVDSRSPKKERMHQFNIRRFDTVGGGELKISFELFRYLQQHASGFDIVHAHNYHSFPALCAALTKKTPIIFSPHYHGTGHSIFTHLLHYPYRYIGKFIFSKSDAILCDTDAEAKLVQKHFPQVKNPAIIPLGIDVQGILKAKRNKNISPYILSTGRLERYKNIDLIIRSLQFLKSDINLKIVGVGSEQRHLEDLTLKLNLASRVSFFKNISTKELLQLFRNAKTFVTMSSMEAYGLSLLEAAAAETGVVASDIPAHRELVERFKINNVSLLNLNSTLKDLASSIQVAMAKPSQAKERLPSWEFVAEQTLQIYEKVLNG